MDIHVLINWHLTKTTCPLTSITLPYRGIKLRAHWGQLFFFLSRPLCWPGTGFRLDCRLNTTSARLHFSYAFCGLTWLHGHTTSTIVLTQSTLFVFRWEIVWKMFSFFIFRWFQPSLTYHDICAPHWWLHSYSSQASRGYKLKLYF